MGIFVYLLVLLQMKLTKERDSLAMTAKKLGRDLAKVSICPDLRKSQVVKDFHLLRKEYLYLN